MYQSKNTSHNENSDGVQQLLIININTFHKTLLQLPYLWFKQYALHENKSTYLKQPLDKR